MKNINLDIITECQRAETAIKRLFDTKEARRLKGWEDWKDEMLESLKSGYPTVYSNGLSYGVEHIDTEKGKHRYYAYIIIGKEYQ